VTVVSRTIPAVNYFQRSGSTKIDFRGTGLLARADGDAKVESHAGATRVDAHFHHLVPASQLGPEYLTYVLWAITPQGRPTNLGEVVLQGDDSSMTVTTPLQNFGLMVTAEPYFAVTQPSDMTILENYIPTNVKGTIGTVQATYQLLRRGSYVANRAAYQPVTVMSNRSLQLAEAENAIQIARLAGAGQYAPEALNKAVSELTTARQYQQSGHYAKAIDTSARAATQTAQDALLITERTIQQNQQAAAQAAAASARQEASREAAEAREAQAARAAAEQAKAEAEAARAEAEQARQQAVQEQQAAQNEAARAQAAAQQAVSQRDQMRERLRQQLNAVMQTRETARGLIMDISDVQFATGKYTLTPGAREKLAKAAGILMAYPGLALRLEGYTDSTGTGAHNLKLSQERADEVKAYLIQQGVSPQAVSAVGYGAANPVASNATATGRSENRRVELVVSGESIGIPNGGQGAPVQPPMTPPQPQQ
jgi:outer membrane protein OmpA-like peptidoglycan-associated protein